MVILNCSTRVWLHISPCDMHAWGTRVGDETGCGKVSVASFVSHLHEESLLRSHLKTFFLVMECLRAGCA